MKRHRFLSTLLLLGALAPGAAGQSFQPGDLYLVSNYVPDPAIPGGHVMGVQQIDTTTGAVRHVATFEGMIFHAIASFDPHRGGILVPGRMAGMSVDTALCVVGANGVGRPLWSGSLGRVSAPTPGVDGRIYWINESAARLAYLDVHGVQHDVLDPSGALISLPYTNALIYDPGTNAIFALTSRANLCGLVGFSATVVERFPLSADGRRTTAAPSTVALCTGPSPWPTSPNHFSRGPAGTLFVSIDDNTNLALTRNFLLDPVTLAVTPFASNGPYTGASSATAAVYSSRLGGALLVDGFNEQLRFYPQGGSGLGTVFARGTGGHTAANTLLEIPALGRGAVSYGTGTPGCAGPQRMGVSEPARVGASDFRFTCTAAPASSSGITLLTNAAWPTGADPFGLGVLLHVDPFQSAFLLDLPMTSSASGLGRTPVAIPLPAVAAGLQLDAQTLWLWTTCQPSPLGLSSSDGLAVFVQL